MFYIYKITNLINGKTYIGKHEYKKLDEYYMGSGKILRRAQKKYGMENFKKDILLFNIVEEDFINLLEEEYIKFYKSIGKAEYNAAKGGEGGYLLKYASEERRNEWKLKLSESHKDKPKSEEHKKHLAEAHKGKHHTEESKRKIAEHLKGKDTWMKGKHHTEESKRKIAEANKGRTPWNKGVPMSEEQRRKNGEAHKGQTPWNKGKSASEETKRKLSEAHKGMHWELVDGKRVWY